MGEKGSSKFQGSLRFAEVTLSEIPSVCAPPACLELSSHAGVTRLHCTVQREPCCCPAGHLKWWFVLRHCSSVLDHHLVVNLGKTTASDFVVKDNGRDCQIWTVWACKQARSWIVCSWGTAFLKSNMQRWEDFKPNGDWKKFNARIGCPSRFRKPLFWFCLNLVWERGSGLL